MPPTWSHGYFTHDVYTAGFFRETAPNWLDFAALAQGAAPPRQQEGDAFRYLDLGCGMGFGIVLLAALYPEGHFVGVDFHPYHIAHGRGLARRFGLTDLQLLEANLRDLQRDPDQRRALLGANPFHYVVSHGVATWVVEPVQQALLAVASASLAPEGLFYCSYNTYPSWLTADFFQQVAEKEPSCSNPADATGAHMRTVPPAAAATARSRSRTPSPLASQHPGGRQVLKQIGSAEADELLQDSRKKSSLRLASFHRSRGASFQRFINPPDNPTINASGCLQKYKAATNFAILTHRNLAKQVPATPILLCSRLSTPGDQPAGFLR